MTIPHPLLANEKPTVQAVRQKKGDVKELPMTTQNILYLSTRCFYPLQKPELLYDQNIFKMHSPECKASGRITVLLE